MAALTKSELVASLQNEVRILLHLCTKIDPAMLDYRPTPKQRSALELLQYLSYMGPTMVQQARAGGFDPDAYGAARTAASARDYEQVLEAIAAMPAAYERLFADMDDEEFRKDIVMFGRPATKGSFLVNTVLSGYAAYRTQLFLYLKACGREELSTMNLWGGMDPPAPA